ncbi:uncharacterized protein LOC115580187 [Sparus aurata]|uniref:uncharacterized protein LOC115580187 n=1 Tax=Sparus aurata TaxID=8175 RepID=UPI0011C0F245|nr:uncharacterized protein LOC115580187 [Sparus aurata]
MAISWETISLSDAHPWLRARCQQPLREPQKRSSGPREYPEPQLKLVAGHPEARIFQSLPELQESRLDLWRNIVACSNAKSSFRATLIRPRSSRVSCSQRASGAEEAHIEELVECTLQTEEKILLRPSWTELSNMAASITTVYRPGLSDTAAAGNLLSALLGSDCEGNFDYSSREPTEEEKNLHFQPPRACIFPAATCAD